MRDQSDKRKAQQELDLTTDQAAALSELKPQECVCISDKSDGPVMSRVPDLELDNLMSVSEIKVLMEPKLEQLSWTPAESQEDPRPRVQIVGAEAGQLAMVLNKISKNYGEPLSAVAKDLGIKWKQLKRILEALQDMGAISMERISLGKSGSSPYYAELLEPAADILGVDYEEIKMPGGKTKSLRGKVMTLKVLNYLEGEGIPAQTEYMGADVSALIDGLMTAFEIETIPDYHIAVNCRRDLKDFAGRVVVVMERVEDLHEAEQKCLTRLRKEELDKIEFKKISEFLPGKGEKK
jgi:hypothetical protein